MAVNVLLRGGPLDGKVQPIDTPDPVAGVITFGTGEVYVPTEDIETVGGEEISVYIFDPDQLGPAK